MKFITMKSHTKNRLLPIGEVAAAVAEEAAVAAVAEEPVGEVVEVEEAAAEEPVGEVEVMGTLIQHRKEMKKNSA